MLKINSMKKLLATAMLVALSTADFVAYSQEFESNSRVNVGIGMGIDYGGIVGGRVTYLPIKKVALFGAVGYNLLDVGLNAGATFRFMPDRRICPTLSAMYGYNSVIKVKGAESFNQTYYGPSFSLGFEVKSSSKSSNHWNFELILPIRPQEFKDDWDTIKNIPGIDIKSEPIPVAVSIGLHFGL
jgi:hypothetical protein